MLRNKEQLMFIIQPNEINRLIMCFLDPSLMSQEHSSASGDISHYQDPVYALFNPDKNDDSMLKRESLVHINIVHMSFF